MARTMKTLNFGEHSDMPDVLNVDFDVLIATRLLIQANSGGGKGWMIRHVAEQLHGRVQQIIIDPEGETVTLREHFDYVIAGSGGDLPIGPKNARQLCRSIMALGVSAILDLSELKKADRRMVVHLFLDELMQLGREFWRPLLVILDEAHDFAPERGKGVDDTARESVAALSCQGRKRGYCLVAATQRLGKLDKDTAAELNNKLIGRTTLDVDIIRAASDLGLVRTSARETLQNLDPPEFLCFGPAISRVIENAGAAATRSSHPKVGVDFIATPPAPERLRDMIAEFNAAAEGEEVEETEDEGAGHARDASDGGSGASRSFNAALESLRSEVATAREAEHRARKDAEDAESTATRRMTMFVHRLGARLADVAFDIAREVYAETGGQADRSVFDVVQQVRSGAFDLNLTSPMMVRAGERAFDHVPKGASIVARYPAHDMAPVVVDGVVELPETNIVTPGPMEYVTELAVAAGGFPSNHPVGEAIDVYADAIDVSKLKPLARSILRALASLTLYDMRAWDRNTVIHYAGKSPRSGSMPGAFRELVDRGLIHPDEGPVKLTPLGGATVGTFSTPVPAASLASYQTAVLETIGKPPLKRIARFLVAKAPQGLTIKQLAGALNKSARSGTWSAELRILQRGNYIVKVGRSTIKPGPIFFPKGLTGESVK